MEKKVRSRSRLEKKSGAGAVTKLAGSSALREDKKHKEIALFFFRERILKTIKQQNK